METWEHVTFPNAIDVMEKKVDGISLGNDFCQNKLPGAKEAVRAFYACRECGMGFGLRTPPLTNNGLDECLKIIRSLAMDDYPFEVVVNDLGLLRMIFKERQNGKLCRVEPVIGRLIARQKTDPVTPSLKNLIPKDAYTHFCRPVAANPPFFSLLLKKDVRRMELENTLQPIELPAIPPKGFAFSLLVPWVNVAFTRMCPAAMSGKKAEGKEMKAPQVTDCRNECRRIDVKAHTPFQQFVFRGNALCYRNDKLPANLNAIGINRIVRIA